MSTIISEVAVGGFSVSVDACFFLFMKTIKKITSMIARLTTNVTSSVELIGEFDACV